MQDDLEGLVEAHGGRIRAESAGPGRGTTFTFTVLVAGKPGDPPPGRRRPQTGTGRRRIIVVDEDPKMLRS